MRAKCPYPFNILFSILSKIVCVTPIFSLITSFRTFTCLEVLVALLQKSKKNYSVVLQCSSQSICQQSFSYPFNVATDGTAGVLPIPARAVWILQSLPSKQLSYYPSSTELAPDVLSPRLNVTGA
jgi:hypothetical protein